MNVNSVAQTAVSATLQTVLDRLDSTSRLSATRKRDLRSAVTTPRKTPGPAPGGHPP